VSAFDRERVRETDKDEISGERGKGERGRKIE
jgi:hypothetical protein